MRRENVDDRLQMQTLLIDKIQPFISQFELKLLVVEGPSG